MRERVAGAVIGTVFGLTLSWSGMSDPAVIRRALLFEDAYLFLMFASAVAVAALGSHLLARRPRQALITSEAVGWRRERPQRRHVVGSLAFGAGWGVAAACPGPIITQLGQGAPWALFAFVGMVAGVVLFLRAGRGETEPAVDRTGVAAHPV